MTRFPIITFRGELRPSQKEVVAVAKQNIAAGDQKIYVNAPPGSGKTVTGLYLWAKIFKYPAVVLSPNSAIQAQWLARTDLFAVDGKQVSPDYLSADPKLPGFLTSLTYQAMTMPSRGGNDLAETALHTWISSLVDTEHSANDAEAEIWIHDLRRHNQDYFNERMSFYIKKVRDEITRTGDALSTLHNSSLTNLKCLRQANVGLVILDECHHLVGHWGRILHAIDEYLETPVIIGLTATPPDPEEEKGRDWEIYQELLGEIDYEVPVPAVIKDGFLAPYKDLCYFVYPSSEELEYISNTSDHMQELLSLLEHVSADDDRESLVDWTRRSLAERKLPLGPAKNWGEFSARLPMFTAAAQVFLAQHDISFPEGVPELTQSQLEKSSDVLAYSIPVIDRYVRLYLMRSANPAHQILADQVKRQLRLLGTQITETGNRTCASPVSRILAYSQSKSKALISILTREQDLLGTATRAVVVCDYEKTSAINAEVSHILDSNAGGAVSAFRTLLTNPQTDQLNPVLVTGSTVLVDDDLHPTFHDLADKWLNTNGYEVKLAWESEAGYRILQARGSDWTPRVYIEMITDLFQHGHTRCLVGTRGLLGEGWDANKINVLVDLTTATTSMTVNQFRGRSIRLDPEVKQKIADNWDIVCLAPEFLKGLSDYKRFCKKAYSHLWSNRRWNDRKGRRPCAPGLYRRKAKRSGPNSSTFIRKHAGISRGPTKQLPVVGNRQTFSEYCRKIRRVYARTSLCSISPVRG